MPPEAEAYSLEAVAEAIAVLLLAIAEQQPQQLQQEAPAVHLVGYSLGGRVALALAARHPLLVARVAIISGSPGLAGAYAWSIGRIEAECAGRHSF